MATPTSCPHASPGVSPQLKLPQIQKVLLEFERQLELMGLREELVNEAIDEALGDEEDEEERWHRGDRGCGGTGDAGGGTGEVGDTGGHGRTHGGGTRETRGWWHRG